MIAPSGNVFMRALTVVTAVSLTATMSAAEVSAPSPIRPLDIGTQRVVRTPKKVRTVAVTNPNVVAAKQTGRSEVLLLGLTRGETTVLVELEDGQRLTYPIKVRDRDREFRESATGQRALELKAQIGEMEGITIRVINDKIYVEGYPLTDQEAQRLKKVLALNPDIRDVTAKPRSF